VGDDQERQNLRDAPYRAAHLRRICGRRIGGAIDDGVAALDFGRF